MRANWMRGMTVLAVVVLLIQIGCSAANAPATMPAAAAPAAVAPAAVAPAAVAPDAVAPDAAIAAATPSTQPTPPLASIFKTPVQASSYALGVETARSYKQRAVDLDPDDLRRGVDDALAGKISLSSVATRPAMASPAATQTATSPATTVPAPATADKGYNMGVVLAMSFKRQDVEMDWDFLTMGMKDVQSGKLLMTDKDLKAIMDAFRAEVIVKAGQERLKTALANQKEEEEFLAKNKTQEGVETLSDGLQYKILKAGDGKKPTAGDTVEVNYRATVANGTEFANTYTAGKPASIYLSDPRVIFGLREALKLMPVGSKWQLVIPARLGYLGRGIGRAVGPNSMLIYEMELLSIKEPQAASK